MRRIDIEGLWARQPFLSPEKRLPASNGLVVERSEICGVKRRAPPHKKGFALLLVEHFVLGAEDDIGTLRPVFGVGSETVHPFAVFTLFRRVLYGSSAACRNTSL